jgi:hypothetical protein
MEFLQGGSVDNCQIKRGERTSLNGVVNLSRIYNTGVVLMIKDPGVIANIARCNWGEEYFARQRRCFLLLARSCSTAAACPTKHARSQDGGLTEFHLNGRVR